MALLHAACALGDLASVRRLIEDGADVNGTQAVKPIIAAALGGHEEVLAHLLAQGCDPELTDAGGHTAAGIAKHRGDQRILRLLYAFRSARLAGQIALERSNLEEERQLLREVEAAFAVDDGESDENDDDDDADDDGDEAGDDDDEADDSNAGDDDDGDNAETRQTGGLNSDDATSPDLLVAKGDTHPPPTHLSCLFEQLQQLHVRFPSVADDQRPSSGELLRVCEDDQLDDLRRLMEGGLSEISAEQRERRRHREQQPAGACQICVDNPTNSVFAPCGHVVCCYTCASRLLYDRCPICRATISQIIRTFFS